jgi:hypothetical protein
VAAGVEAGLTGTANGATDLTPGERGRERERGPDSGDKPGEGEVFLAFARWFTRGWLALALAPAPARFSMPQRSPQTA